MFRTYSMSADYRFYNEFIPNYLRERPHKVILDQKQKAHAFSEDDITTVDATNGVFMVKSQSGKIHTIDFGKESTQPQCSCKDWTRHHIPCKHFFTIFCYKPQWQWDSLPLSYLQSEYLSQDVSHLPTSLADCSMMDVQPTPDDHAITLDEIPKWQVCLHNYRLDDKLR